MRDRQRQVEKAIKFKLSYLSIFRCQEHVPRMPLQEMSSPRHAHIGCPEPTRGWIVGKELASIDKPHSNGWNESSTKWHAFPEFGFFLQSKWFSIFAQFYSFLFFKLHKIQILPSVPPLQWYSPSWSIWTGCWMATISSCHFRRPATPWWRTFPWSNCMAMICLAAILTTIRKYAKFR